MRLTDKDGHDFLLWDLFTKKTRYTGWIVAALLLFLLANFVGLI